MTANNGKPIRPRNSARQVGESYRDCVDRLLGELRAMEIDRDCLATAVERLTTALDGEIARREAASLSAQPAESGSTSVAIIPAVPCPTSPSGFDEYAIWELR